MLPHSFSKTTLKNRVSEMESGSTEDDDENVDKEYDYLNADIILENEEEYDILNDETFGDNLTGPANEDENLEIEPSWENYDLHNNETFGEDVDYDWEAEHEKLVSILEESPHNAGKETANRLSDNSAKKSNIVKNTEVLGRNGFRRIDNLVDSYVLRNDGASHPADTSVLDEQRRFDDDESRHELTNDTYNLLKQDEWNKHDVDNSTSGNEPYNGESPFARNYSLFSSGANLLQNAGIYIPSVTNAISTPTQSRSIENITDGFDSMKVQASISDIPSVSDLEKQWINNAATSKPAPNEDCFKAYNSAVFANKTTSVQPPPPPFNLTDNVRNTNSPGVVPLEKMVYAGGLPTGAKILPLNGGLQFANKAAFTQPPPQLMSEAGIILYNNIRLRNISNPNAPLPVNPIINTNAFKLSMSKLHDMMDPTVLVSSEAAASAILVNNRLASIPGLLANAADSIPNLNVFPPPPGINIDPSKLVRVADTTSLPPHSQLSSSSYLTLPPSQALNGVVTIEQQRQLMKMQKEGDLSTNVDEFAGMMTEREKYWLAGVQLLQINGMDPYKDDYYFTNYQARRKGNRNKNQNQNNSTNWKNQHTKDYSPLQFENSLGRVQVGSVVAPRKVIDTCLFESSPIQSSRLSDSMADDPIANTSNRKRKAIMLLIEDMYAKVVALEYLQSNLNRSKNDPATIKAEFENIVAYLEDEILNLKEDFKIVMSIKKGKRLVLRFLSFCDRPGQVWYQIFEILDRIIRGDAEHCILLSYLPYFRAWLSTTDLSTLIRIAEYFNRDLGYYLQDKFSVSAMANMIEHAELTYYSSKSEEQNLWMEFVVGVAEKAHSSFESIQRPVISVKPQVLRSHLLKCKKLENGYMSYLLKIFSNNIRK